MVHLFPWRQPGLLEGFDGPQPWQAEVLRWVGEEVRARRFDGRTPVMPIRKAVSKGHGAGGSVLAAVLVNWILSTRPYAIGTVTANTSIQLKTRTWAAVMRWRRLNLVGQWFGINQARMYHPAFPESWFCSPQTCKPENSEAFAGQHSATSTSFYINDEDCFSADTDILTRRGWIRVGAVRPDDDCVTMSQETGLATYMRPKAVHWAHRRGLMLQHRRQNASWCVTPHHRMWAKRWNHRRGAYGPFRWVAAESIGPRDALQRHIDWGAPDVEWFTIPAFVSDRKQFPARLVRMDAWVAFLGWYFSEGNLVSRVNRFSQREYISIGISNRDVAPVQRLAAALGFIGRAYRANGSAWNLRFHDRALAEYLAPFGASCLTRTLPSFLRDLSARQIGLFLDSYVAGDGYHKTPKLDVIYTSSPALADALHELCLKSGATSTLSTRRLMASRSAIAGRPIRSSRDGFAITRSRQRAPMTFRQGRLPQRIEYDGLIYCVELPTHHLVFTRRDGVCVWSGNSGVPDIIHEVEEGGLARGEPMVFLFGNATRNRGKFYEAVFGRDRGRWSPSVIDARTTETANLALIQEWIETYGEDSDFVRVRVKGLPPRAAELQYIDVERIWAAQKREVFTLPGEPLIAGVDVSGGGDSWNVVRFRRGADARSIPPIRIPGEKTRNDRTAFLTILANLLAERDPLRKVDMMFIDTAFGGPYVVGLKALGYDNVMEVNGGALWPPDPYAYNYRAYMWSAMKEWLRTGAIPARDEILEHQLGVPGYHINRQQLLVIESKESIATRNEASPDDADALAYTFAAPVAPSAEVRRAQQARDESVPRRHWQGR